MASTHSPRPGEAPRGDGLVVVQAMMVVWWLPGSLLHNNTEILSVVWHACSVALLLVRKGRSRAHMDGMERNG